MDDLERFVSLIFKHTPNGKFFYLNEINKATAKPYPEFFRSEVDLSHGITSRLVSDGARHTTDLYFSPSVYHRPTRAIKANCAGASCVWVDCDGELPEFETPPSILIESSPGRHHAYWLLPTFREASTIEEINKGLQRKYNTDKSGWDSTQLLRPPGSVNRKRNNHRAQVLSVNEESHTFTTAVRPSEHQQPSRPGMVVLSQSKLPAKIVRLLLKETASANGEGRSGLMFSTACALIEHGVNEADTKSLLFMQDDRLKKFTNHSDRQGQIDTLYANALERVAKHAPPVGRKDVRPLFSIWQGNKQFLEANEEVEDDQIIEHMFYEEGMIVLAGEPGVGKSRVGLQMADSIGCGKAFFGKKIIKPRRTGYLSLDMNNRRVRDIRKRQMFAFTEQEQDLINENVYLFIRGYGLDLTDSENQKKVQDIWLANQIEVQFIDVLARAVPSMLDDKCAVAFLDWIQMLMVEHGMSFGLITHTRKSPVGGKVTQVLDDYYGSRHWSIPPDHGYTLVRASGEMRLIVNKDRSGELPEMYRLSVDFPHSYYSLKSLVEQKPGDEEKSEKVGGIDGQGTDV